MADATKSKEVNAHSTISTVAIYDQQGNLKKYQKFGNLMKVSIDISVLNSGTYFVEIADGDYKEWQQLIIQK